MIVDGQEVCYKNPQEAEKAGIVFIHQELNVLFDLTVEENMFLGKEIKKGFGVCDKKAMRQEVKKILDRLGVNIDPGQRMNELSVGQQQMIEIAKALMVDAKVIIMDVKYSIVLIVYGVYRVREKLKIGTTYTNRKKNVYDVTWKRIRKILKSGIGSSSFFMP